MNKLKNFKLDDFLYELYKTGNNPILKNIQYGGAVGDDDDVGDDGDIGNNSDEYAIEFDLNDEDNDNGDDEESNGVESNGVESKAKDNGTAQGDGENRILITCDKMYDKLATTIKSSMESADTLVNITLNDTPKDDFDFILYILDAQSYTAKKIKDLHKGYQDFETPFLYVLAQDPGKNGCKEQKIKILDEYLKIPIYTFKKTLFNKCEENKHILSLINKVIFDPESIPNSNFNNSNENNNNENNKEAPATEAPATEAPATEAPATEAPNREVNKSSAIKRVNLNFFKTDNFSFVEQGVINVLTKSGPNNKNNKNNKPYFVKLIKENLYDFFETKPILIDYLKLFTKENKFCRIILDKEILIDIDIQPSNPLVNNIMRNSFENIFKDYLSNKKSLVNNENLNNEEDKDLRFSLAKKFIKTCIEHDDCTKISKEKLDLLKKNIEQHSSMNKNFKFYLSIFYPGSDFDFILYHFVNKVVIIPIYYYIDKEDVFISSYLIYKNGKIYRLNPPNPDNIDLNSNELSELIDDYLQLCIDNSTVASKYGVTFEGPLKIDCPIPGYNKMTTSIWNLYILVLLINNPSVDPTKLDYIIDKLGISRVKQLNNFVEYLVELKSKIVKT